MEIPLLTMTSILSFFLIAAASPPPPSSAAASKFTSCLPNCFPNPSAPISDFIYTPQNASFSSILQAYIKNSRFNRSTTPKPAAIVAAKHYCHVQAVVSCARSSGIQLRIRSGGHDWEGLSYVSDVPFVILDMFNMREIQIDLEKEEAWAEAGAILGELYHDVAKMSNDTLAFPAGVGLTLGVGGHVTGGGYGPLLRKYGLSIDNVIDALVVDANSRILNRSTMGEDFFWAIRGGGAASFGVVLAWKLRLVRVPQTVTVFMVSRTLEEGATDIVDQWQSVAHEIDPDLFIRAQPQARAGSGGNESTVRVAFVALYVGGAGRLVALVKERLPLLGLELKDCVEMTWAQSTLYWYGLPKGTPLEKMLVRSSPPNNYHKNKSDYIKKPIPKQGWEVIWKKMIEVGPNILLQFNPYGGKMAEIAADATPFPHRAGNLFKMQYISFWGDASLGIEKKSLMATKELYDTFAPYVSSNPREAFLNYRDLDVGTNENGELGFALDYSKGNVPRLLKVKAEVDPDNFFKYEQSIPVKKLQWPS